MQKILPMHAKLPLTIFKEGKKFVAYTPALDLSTSGKSLSQVRKRFAEAVSLFMEECLERGTLSSTLANLGWRRARFGWEPPHLVMQTTEKVRVAFR